MPEKITYSRLLKLIVSATVSIFDFGYNAFQRCDKRYLHGVMLYYHTVPQQHAGQFSRQMEMVQRLLVMSKSDGSSVGSLKDRVAITFDDGFSSLFSYAIPELISRNIPYMIFVPSGNLGRRPDWVTKPGHPYFNERVMTPEELKKVVTTSRCVIGSHTHTHAKLSILDEKKAEEEITVSKRHLENILGRSVVDISFPHGLFTEKHLLTARNAGYQRAFAIEPKTYTRGTDEFLIGRVGVSASDSLLEFFLKLHGTYRWMYQLSRAKISFLLTGKHAFNASLKP